MSAQPVIIDWVTSEVALDPSMAMPGAFVGANLALVALQRYNRARLMGSVNQRLREGDEFSAGYENWMGLDSRAIRRYRDSEAARAANRGNDPGPPMGT